MMSGNPQRHRPSLSVLELWPTGDEPELFPTQAGADPRPPHRTGAGAAERVRYVLADGLGPAGGYLRAPQEGVEVLSAQLRLLWLLPPQL